jgi:hypothetical protein
MKTNHHLDMFRVSVSLPVLQPAYVCMSSCISFNGFRRNLIWKIFIEACRTNLISICIGPLMPLFYLNIIRYKKRKSLSSDVCFNDSRVQCMQYLYCLLPLSVINLFLKQINTINAWHRVTKSTFINSQVSVCDSKYEIIIRHFVIIVMTVI